MNVGDERLPLVFAHSRRPSPIGPVRVKVSGFPKAGKDFVNFMWDSVDSHPNSDSETVF